ncbi:hypothetical protein GCM10027167_54380 [Nocardia heshunensis]
MSSAHPDSGLPAPAPHEAPLSAAEANRLLDSIRQAEHDLAVTGEHIAVSPTAESTTATPESDNSGEVLEADVPADAVEQVFEAAVSAAEEFAAPTAEKAVVAADEYPAAVTIDAVVGSAAEVSAESAAPASESGESGVIGAVPGQFAAEVAGHGNDGVVVGSAAEVFAAVATAADEFVAGEGDSEHAARVSEFVESAAFVAEVVVEIDPADEGSTEPAADVAADEVRTDEVAVVEVEEAVAADEPIVAASGLILPGDVVSDAETIVHVMRHGEVHNPKGILYGRLSGFGLSVTGRAQAQTVARSLADHDIALVVASPLQRAQETAEPIALGHGLSIRTDENLIEAGNTFEGLRVSPKALRKPRHWLKLRDPFTPSWGEPYLQIAHRMLAAVNKARVEAAGREAVLVSHQLPVWTLRRFLQGQRLWHDPRNRQCSLASLTSLVYQGDTLIDIVYSEPAGASDPAVTGA